MCSIIAYKGNKQAAPILVKALKRMEYRGYDSVGIATVSDKHILVKKGVGKVEEVNKFLDLENLDGNIGIGHTRWATHGGITDNNAHPHKGCRKSIVIVHNGKIENYEELKNMLISKGHRFSSETDSEAIAHLIEEYIESNDIKNTMLKVCSMIKGAYAFVAAFDDGTLAGTRLDEPLIIGVARDGYYISSDVLGFIEYTDQAIFLDNNEIVVISKDIYIYSRDGRRVKKNPTQIAWELAAADKGIYAHYTLKEINEQKYTIERAFSSTQDKLKEFVNTISAAKHLLLVGSGTSYNAALVAKHLFSRVGIQCEAVIASEFQYHYNTLTSNSVLVAISQSGETRDVLKAVGIARSQGIKVISLVNVPTSSLARESDLFLTLNCGPEIGVAATKSFTAQLALFYSIVSELSSSSLNIKELSRAVETVLNVNVEKTAEDLKDEANIYVLGRGVHYIIALEAALKLKELAYVHAEGMPAGEFRHGPLALVDNKTTIIMINPKDETYDNTFSNMHEIKARGGKIIGVSDVENKHYDQWIKLPTIDPKLYPIVEIIPLQLLAYHLALKREYNPDYPRNLAKSVTVD